MTGMNRSRPLAFGKEVTRKLRLAAHLAQGERVAMQHLRAAIEQSSVELPPVTVHLDALGHWVLERAGHIAGAAVSSEIGLQHLEEALAEEQALAAGLALDRLRFARWQVERCYPASPRLRRYPARLT